MKSISDWEREPIGFAGDVFEPGVRGQSIQLSQRELAALRNAAAILENLQKATDPNGNGDRGEYAHTNEDIAWARTSLAVMLEECPSGRFRVDTFKPDEGAK